MSPRPASHHEPTQPEANNDCSWNARTDMLGKYSRFHGNTEFSVWCNSPSMKYTDCFRDVVYQISPYNITCVYKKMFEQYAIYNLRLVDNDGVSDDESELASFSREPGSPGGGLLLSTALVGGRQGYSSEPASPRPATHHVEHVDKSNSCIYTVSSIAAKYNTCPVKRAKLVSGWRTCERPHSSGVTGYQSMTIEEAREARKSGKTGINIREPACKTFQSSLRNPYARNPQHMALCKYETQGSSGYGIKKSARERGDETGSHRSSISMTSLSISPIKVGRRFKHFRRSNSYIDQYRDEYTYRKLRDAHDPSQPLTIDALMCSCGNSACSGSLTAARCIQRWYPNQSHTLKTQNITACEKTTESVSSGVPPVPKRVPVPKKRPAQSQSQARVPSNILACKLEEAQRKGGYPKEGGHGAAPRLEFFATSFTVNSYNPTSPNMGGAHSSASSSPSPLALSASFGSIGGGASPALSPAPQTRGPRRPVNHNLKGLN